MKRSSSVSAWVVLALMTAALGCGGDTPSGPVLPDGPFVDITLPEGIEPDVPNLMTVTAGVRENGNVSYTDGAVVQVDVDMGDSENGGSEEGFTDANGKFTANLLIDPSENGVAGDVTVEFPGGAVIEKTFDRLRRNSLEIQGREYRMELAAEFGYRREGQTEFTIVYDDVVNEGSVQGPIFDESIILESSAKESAMIVRADGTAELTAALENHEDGSLVISNTANLAASLDVTNPEPDFREYEANVYGYTYMSVEIEVWGEPAELTMTATADKLQHAIVVDPDELLLCEFRPDGSEPGCGGEYSVTLEPGSYQLFVILSSWLAIGTSYSEQSGNQQIVGGLEVDVTIAHDD